MKEIELSDKSYCINFLCENLTKLRLEKFLTIHEKDVVRMLKAS